MSRFPLLERLSVWAFALAFVVLTVTGVAGAWILRTPLEGYPLLLHVAAGGLFAVGLGVLVVLWGESCRFDGRNTGRKTCFWLMVVAGVGLILSAVLPMFPWLGTEGQRWMLGAHGFCTWLALLAAIVYGVLAATRARTK